MLPRTSPKHFWSRRQKRVMLLLVCAFFMTGATTIASAAGIHSAAKRGKVAKVETLLEKKPTLLESRKGKYANRWTNTRENTPLHIAAVYGQLKVVELLLQKGATVDARNDGRATPLHLAAMNKHQEVAELLLAKGADPSAKMYGENAPLHLAVLPIEGGVKMDLTGRAWFSGSHAGTELVELLLAQGVDINVRNDKGNTPLHTAAWIAGTDEVIEVLLAQGADPNIRNNSGRTPLMSAERYGRQANAELLRVAVSATAADETTNHKIQMPHYSLALSPDHSWHIEKLGGPFESVLLTKQMATTPLGPVVVEIKFMRNTITDEGFRAKTARWNADNFRTIEKNIMIEQGVNTGMYELGDVTMGEEEIAGNTFYFTDYKTYTSSDRQWSSLYLFFPKEKDNDAFIVAHHSVRMPLEAVLFEYSKTDLIDLLRTLNVE